MEVGVEPTRNPHNRLPDVMLACVRGASGIGFIRHMGITTPIAFRLHFSTPFKLVFFVAFDCYVDDLSEPINSHAEQDDCAEPNPER